MADMASAFLHHQLPDEASYSLHTARSKDDYRNQPEKSVLRALQQHHHTLRPKGDTDKTLRRKIWKEFKNPVCSLWHLKKAPTAT